MYAAEQLVLIVEDNAEIRRAMRRLLRSFGYRVIEAQDCTQAHELASTETPDAVITDAELPTLDILRSRFASDETLRRVPLVIVDGEAETLQPLDGVTMIRDFDSLASLLRRPPASSGAMHRT